jgi:hypothetical protein
MVSLVTGLHSHEYYESANKLEYSHPMIYTYKSMIRLGIAFIFLPAEYCGEER